MGCGSSGTVVANQEEANGQVKVTNGKHMSNGGHDSDDLPTVVLPDTPIQAKSPIAFEIPVEEFEGNRRPSNLPPAHLQRLLQAPQNDISLPDIEEKLAEAEQRRLSILQQRAISAQNRVQKIIKSSQDKYLPHADFETTEASKIGINTLKIPTEAGIGEDKNIT